MAELAEYYARRAREYERVYAKPERQAELAALRAQLGALLAGRHVLELACGTGWWTEALAPVAAQITALDVSEAVLDIARAKRYPAGRVTFAIADCYALPDYGRRHDALFAGFWWSHVPRARLERFLRDAERAVAPGALCVFIDNCFVAGSSTPILRRDAAGNTWQRRRLDDGSEHEVLKNFPDEGELRRAVGRGAHEVRVQASLHYWLLGYCAP